MGSDAAAKAVEVGGVDADKAEGAYVAAKNLAVKDIDKVKGTDAPAAAAPAAK
jgi:hypothetical protein